MNRLATLATVCALIALVYAESKTNQPAKSDSNKIKPVVRRMWAFEPGQQSDSPIFRALNNMDQQPEPLDMYYPSYTPITAPMSPNARAYYPENLYMDYMMQQWIQEAQKREMERQMQQRNNGAIDGAIYIPALANGAFGGPITVANQQGQQTQEELVPVTLGGSNSVESAPTSAECRSGLNDQRPYYPSQFRSSFYQPGPFFNHMDYYPLPYYPRQFDYYGFPY